MAEWQRCLRFMQRRITARDDAMRVDRWLRQHFPEVSHSFLQKQLRQRKIRIVPSTDADGSIPAKAHAILRTGDSIAIDAVLFDRGLGSTSADSSQSFPSPALVYSPLNQSKLKELLDRLIYQDDNFLVLNKPHGLAVQDGTALEESLAEYLPGIGAASDGETPRLVHRLDKETSGVLVLARHRLAAARFSELLRDGRVGKTYDALVRPLDFESDLPKKGEINVPIDGKPAVTKFRRTNRPALDGTQWLEMQPVTGRKHQLRIHCARGLNAPIVGDHRHGLPRERRDVRLMLHSKRIVLEDPFHPGRVIDVSCKMDPLQQVR